MKLHLEGSTPIRAPRETVFNLLTDVGFLGKSLPDSEDIHIIDSSSLEAKMKVKISIVSSTLNFRLSLTDLQPPSRARLIGEGSGSGSSIKIDSSFNLVGDSTTEMRWSADAEINGVMAGLGSTLLRGFAAKKVNEIFDGITRAVEQEAGR